MMPVKKQLKDLMSIYRSDSTSIQEGVPIEEYHNPDLNPGLSSTVFRNIAVSPEYAFYKRRPPVESTQTKPTKPKQTKDMLEGSLIHCVVNEPETFEEYYMLTPAVNRKTNAGKEEYARLMEEAEGKHLITEDQWMMALGCRDSVHGNREARMLIEASKAEVSGFVNVEGTQTLKARPDLVINKHFFGLAYIKSRQGGAAVRDQFIRDLINYKIYLQAALQVHVWETHGQKVETYYYLLVEKAAPYQCVVYPLDRQFIDIGIIELNQLFIRWHQWMKEPTPGYGYYQPALEPPAWFIKKQGEDDE